MAGLLQQGMQPQGAPQGGPPQPRPPQGQPGTPRAQEGEPRERRGQKEASPEQAKEQTRALLEAGLGYLYGDGMKPAAQAMRNAPDPQAGMAKVIGSVMLTAFNTLQSSGASAPPNVMMAFGINLSKAVGEMAMEAGVLQGDDPEAIEGAFMDGLARFGKLVDKQALGDDQRQQYAEMIRGLRQMKEGGGQSAQAAPPRGEPQRQPPRGGPRRPEPQPAQGGM